VLRDATVEDIGSVLSLWKAAGGPPSLSDTHEGLSRLVAADPRALRRRPRAVRRCSLAFV